MKFSKTALYLSRRLLYYKIFFDTKIGFKKNVHKLWPTISQLQRKRRIYKYLKQKADTYLSLIWLLFTIIFSMFSFFLNFSTFWFYPNFFLSVTKKNFAQLFFPPRLTFSVNFTENGPFLRGSTIQV